MDREKEREIELESTMYTNCLMLGLDPSVIGAGAHGGAAPVGLFRHSNPKLGEQLLHFILSSLRGPAQSAKDFDKVWPIFDSAQSRDFRKVVQSIISELESHGALPRSNSRVSSLATCCGPRFVELLWQLSMHALREVLKRSFPADVASNPLPAPLTDVAFSHASTLLPITKARIALERRKFLKDAETAVQRQTMWSRLAHEMTAEFRGLCAEEAYLQQELEKLHDLRNKVKLEGEQWDEVVSNSSQNSHLVQRATRLWDSLLSRKSQHEVLASGPIEDLIAHREHRYRISGSSILAAMDQSSQIPSAQSGDSIDDKEQRVGSFELVTIENQENVVDDRSGRIHATVDLAEIIRRWTHALQRIHKQALQLTKANNGDGPELLRSAPDGSNTGHSEALSAILSEHRQHLASIQVLINQLKGVAPEIQKSIMELTEEVDGMSSYLPQPAKHHGRSTSPIQTQSSAKTMASSSDDMADVTSTLAAVRLEKVSSSSSTLKLPPLFSVTPSSSAKGGNAQRRSSLGQTNPVEDLSESKPVDQPLSNNLICSSSLQDGDNAFVQNIKRSVREAALSIHPCSSESLPDNRSDDSSEHFFIPLSATGFSCLGTQKKLSSGRNKLLSTSQDHYVRNHASKGHALSKFKELPHALSEMDSFHDYDGENIVSPSSNSTVRVSDQMKSDYDMDGIQEQVFSPPLLMDASFLGDSYEDLLAPLSDIETALIEH